MKKIIVNIAHNQSRAAILEDGRLIEFYVEKPTEKLVGNIYIGKVVNVLPGMQAAFVDIGIGRNAFLYVGDAININENEKGKVLPNINEVLKEGQKLIVQVKKEPFGTKGPRVTAQISLPGRYLVYMPNGSHIGVSKKITDDEERNRLRTLGDSLRQEQESLIIRTKATEASDEQLKRDIEFLRGLWLSTTEQSKKINTPSLIYKDLDLVARLVRDLLTEDVLQFVIDDGFEYRKIKEMIKHSAPEFVERLSLYTDKQHIFDAYDIQAEIDKATRRKIWLKSGGYIIIDKTEALTVIDVNTGKYIGHSRLEDTVLKTNLEAAVEIARQLRLRDIGGIIIIDFIDMENEDNRLKILEVLEEELKKDSTKSKVLGLTQLGLVEITRKKVRQSLDSVLLRSCPMCDGTGRVISEDEIYRKIEREIASFKEHTSIKSLIIEVHPLMVPYFKGTNQDNLQYLEKISDKLIYIKGNSNLHFHHYNIQFM
ncbi:hypothetical protein BHF71_03175 [Vulcanibacillus modesticaldus]|uniref:Ribonuclease G n=1 Tax=Vulcanibacillus modesticaldus TaxID=337097 RepID=A0A1D2YSQ0_9BACI|nr:Rne/Rng family ribonuclease [Vulcanibacillus modesticaldus]OEF98037.1 hypothetical protein BHF71_03175 [Vulcanibacillus modesticaldus]